MRRISKRQRLAETVTKLDAFPKVGESNTSSSSSNNSTRRRTKKKKRRKQGIMHVFHCASDGVLATLFAWLLACFIVFALVYLAASSAFLLV
jgi:hypothetical protein